MHFAPIIRALAEAELVQGEATPEPHEARQLFSAMLDGGLPELELGALLLAMGRPMPLWAMLGFEAALSASVLTMPMPLCQADGARAVVIPAYGGARLQRNLTPLLALLLQRLRVPVLVHGTLEGGGRVAAAYVFRELGIMPCMTLGQASDALRRQGLAFVPTGVVAPGLAQVMTLRKRTGIDGLGQAMAALIDPFAGAGLRLVSAGVKGDLARLREVLLSSGQDALLMAATEGEAYANPLRRPRVEWIREGAAMLLFEQEHWHEGAAELPFIDVSPRATAAYVRQVLDGAMSLPQPLANQLACCLYAAGHAADFNQAKAVVAVAVRSLVAV